jgi:hypothetical protein
LHRQFPGELLGRHIASRFLSNRPYVSTPFIPNYKTFKNLGKSKHLKFDQNYREKYKNL